MLKSLGKNPFLLKWQKKLTHWQNIIFSTIIEIEFVTK